MFSMRPRTALIAVFLSTASAAGPAGIYRPEEAALHVGEQATVCGVVASSKYAAQSRGQPTFLNLGTPYPKHVFTALIWGDSRPAFPYAPESLRGEGICVSGAIEHYKGKAEIIVTDPAQITKAADRP